MDFVRELTLQDIVEQPLVVLVFLIGSGAFLAGTFSLIAPNAALQVYGVDTNRTSSKGIDKSPRDNYEPLSRSLSIRNVTLGLSILTLTACWQSIAKEDAAARHILQMCLGYIITIGSAAPLADAYGAWTDGSERLRLSTTILHLFRFCAWITGGVWCLQS